MEAIIALLACLEDKYSGFYVALIHHGRQPVGAGVVTDKLSVILS